MNVLPERFTNSTTTSDTGIEWEEVNCLLCGSSRWQVLLEAPDRMYGNPGFRFAVVECQDCGLCFTNPRPNPGSMAMFYPENYGPYRSSHEPGQTCHRRRRATMPRWLVRKHQPLPMQGEGRLLDFGCGGGRFLEQMRACGWTVTGVDASAKTVLRLRHEQGLTVHAGSLPHRDLQPATFDVITMWHSLEHVHYPMRVLTAAFDLLVPGGKLIVAAPNIESLPYRWFGPAWYGLDLPRHLLHFAPDTLRGMLQMAGFDVEPVRMVRHSSWLRMSAKIANRQHRSLWRWFCRAKPASRLLSWYNCLTRQSDCIMATAVKPVE